MDLISVIVPVYKASEFLSECVKSLVNQTYKNIEIILVDDGSPDQCPKMCDDWAKIDDRIVVIHQKNSGVSKARNAGIDISTGKFIAFVDSDDFIHEDCFKILHENIIKRKTDLLCMRHINVNDKAEVIERNVLKAKDLNFNIPYTGDEFASLMFSDLSISVVWDKLYTREIIGNNRFKVGVFSEEMVFLMEVLHPNARAIYIEDELYYYRKRDESITSGFNEKFYIDRVNNIFLASEIACKKFSNIHNSSQSAKFKAIGSFLALMPYSFLREKRKSYTEVKTKLYNIKKQLKSTPLEPSIKLFLRVFLVSKHFAKFIMGIYKTIFSSKL